ncbi:MAG: chorismate lyase [Halofilum sp. (in: g-proteobacteria)]|nr:chorismate lyase [Halofilum sp. (in: g-proteobacteria)]
MSLPRNPRWQTVNPLLRRRLPDSVRDWVLSTGSLTAGVREQCPDTFRLRVLRQRWARPRSDEASALRLQAGGRAMLREVALCCGERPLIMARTVIPAASLRGRQARLAALGRRPLGELLFHDPSVQRGPFQVAYQTLGQAGLAADARRHVAVWGRRAVFHIGGVPLLVSEFFLPELWR